MLVEWRVGHIINDHLQWIKAAIGKSKLLVWIEVEHFVIMLLTAHTRSHGRKLAFNVGYNN